MKYYIDCEFDGHGGPLLSIAMVTEDGASIYIKTLEAARDPWVIANVVPHLDSHDAGCLAQVPSNEVGEQIIWFLDGCRRPVIVADSPVDIGRFCAAISTASDGGWASAEYPLMTFEVHNVDCYPTDLPGAVQHNAWWDAMALRHKLAGEHPTKRRGAEDAAPELQDALSEALGALNTVTGWQGPYALSGAEAERVIAQARAALAKARGQ